jgi:hypothetical protein
MLERRKYKRASFSGVVDVFDVFYNFISRASVYNISPEGTAIISSTPIGVGRTVKFNIMREETEGNLIVKDVEGEVLRTEKRGDQWVEAVLFKNINEEKNSALKSMCY